MSGEQVRLGGMALANGVLVHGPTYWACAVRADDGGLRVASGVKPLSDREPPPGLATPVRVAQVLALLPVVRRDLPEVELPFAQPRILGAMAASLTASRLLRASRLPAVVQEGAASLLSLVPALLALRGTELAAYHGAEHVSIGTYEHGATRPREHERCGSHLLAPLLAATVLGNALASRAARTPRGRSVARTVASIAALGVAGEVFGWMLRNPGHPVSRALAWPGEELQHRFLTSEPSADQLEVADAALQECLRLETAV